MLVSWVFTGLTLFYLGFLSISFHQIVSIDVWRSTSSQASSSFLVEVMNYIFLPYYYVTFSSYCTFLHLDMALIKHSEKNK